MTSFSPASFTVGSNATVRLRVDGMDCPMSPLETADSALLKNDIRGVAELVGLSRTTLANVKANVASPGVKGDISGHDGAGDHRNVDRRFGRYRCDRPRHHERAASAAIPVPLVSCPICRGKPIVQDSIHRFG